MTTTRVVHLDSGDYLMAAWKCCRVWPVALMGPNSTRFTIGRCRLCGQRPMPLTEAEVDVEVPAMNTDTRTGAEAAPGHTDYVLVTDLLGSHVLCGCGHATPRRHSAEAAVHDIQDHQAQDHQAQDHQDHNERQVHG